jgi:ATP-binding cassette, subfamily C (CFTR/MRP), member 1
VRVLTVEIQVNLPNILCTFLLFAAYSIIAEMQGSESLTISQAVASLSLVSLISIPLGTLSGAIPMGWEAVGCFQRIQEFLVAASRHDERLIQAPIIPSTDDRSSDIELRSYPIAREPELELVCASFGWAEDTQPTVQDVTSRFGLDNWMTIVVGPVGCGKSTFLKGLLGETTSVDGRVRLSSPHVAYCDQTPWIMSGSIRDNIIGESEFNESWYRRVLRACALDTDLQQMDEGDYTIVGSKGVKLSGGQKQRIVSTSRRFWGFKGHTLTWSPRPSASPAPSTRASHWPFWMTSSVD